MSYFVGGAALVGAVGTAVVSNNSSKKAAGAAGKASDATIAENARQFDLVRNDTAGQRFIGDQALGRIAQLYGYGSVPTSYGAGGTMPTAYQAQPMADNGFFNTGAGRVVNPWSVTSKLGGAGKILDPAGGLLGNLFGNTHGDEKRNLQAFLKDNQVYELGDGNLALADGTVFPKEELQSLAGAYYGATYAPDGNKEGWQRTYSDQLSGLATKYGRTTAPTTPGAAPPAAGTGKPDMSAFFESPDYQFNLGEGQKAIDRSLVARGRALSGSGVKEGERYASGLASREYSSFMDRLLQQAGLGTTGIGASAAAGANATSNISQAFQNAGAARGSAYMTAGQGLNNAIQGGTGNLLLMKYLQTPTAYPMAGPSGAGMQANNWTYGKTFGSYV